MTYNPAFQSAAGLIVPRLQGSLLATDFDRYRQMAEDGFGGFIVFGAELGPLRESIRELQKAAVRPLLILSDLEQGSGQHVAGGTLLPPAMAMARVAAAGAEGLELFRAAYRLAAAEARAAGINMILAPVADLHLNPKNPIICTRSFGSDAGEVSRLVKEHILAIEGPRHDSGVLACVKHFPGHGRPDLDSHLTLPTVDADRDTLMATDLVPFRAAIEAGVSSVMAGHLLVPALDPDRPASLSRPILTDMLRKAFGFDGVIMTDAMNMAGVRQGMDEAGACLMALEAGCDLILHPDDPYDAAERMAREGERLASRIGEAADRMELLRRKVSAVPAPSAPQPPDEALAAELSRRAVEVVKGGPDAGREVIVIVLDEDETPDTGTFLASRLTEGGVRVTFRRPKEGADVPDSGGRPVIVCLYSKISAWKGRSGFSPWRMTYLEDTLKRSPGAMVVSFGCPLLLDGAGKADTLVQAWWPGRHAEEAVADLLLGGNPCGRVAVELSPS